MFSEISSRQALVVVIGGANIDLRGRPSARLIPATSNPGIIHRHPGGAGRNIAENLARLGASVRLLSAVGKDQDGSHLIEATAAAGVDMSGVLVWEGESTASYLAILDDPGSLVVAISDMGVLEALSGDYLKRNRKLIEDSDLVVLDANPSPQTIAAAVDLASQGGVPIAVVSVSQPKAARIKPHLGAFSFLFCQEDEAEILSETDISNKESAVAAALELVRKGIGLAVITLGEKGVAYATPSQDGHLPALSVQVVDATGAGDALAAATLFGAMSGLSAKSSLELGLAAAALTVQSEGTVSQELSPSRLREMIASS